MSSSGLEEASASAASCFRASGVTPALAARWLVEALENSCPGLTSAALSALPSALGRLSSLASPQGTLLALLDTARPAALLEPARACELRRRAVDLEISRWLTMLSLEFVCAAARGGRRATWSWPIRNALLRDAAGDWRAVQEHVTEVHGLHCASSPPPPPPPLASCCICPPPCASLHAALGTNRARLLACAQWMVASALLPMVEPLQSAAAAAVAALPRALPRGQPLPPLGVLYPSIARLQARFAAASAKGGEEVDAARSATRDTLSL